MADAEDSKSFARKGVRVQIPLRAPIQASSDEHFEFPEFDDKT